MKRSLISPVLVALFLAAPFGCSSSSNGKNSDDLVSPDASQKELPGGGDVAPELDLTPDVVPADDLPNSLAVAFLRPDKGVPLTDDEIRAFTLRVLRFLKEKRYFDYVLYTTHGVDASTGKRDFQFWYNEHFRKDGDTVTFYHPVNLNDGGHNLHIPFSRVLGNVIAANLLVDDPVVELAAEQLCKGMSASMLGMVYDEDDPLPHLMTRNIATFNHSFLTHDGKKKAVDYSGWYSPYERWNCDRFLYENNPYWGEVWVTNLRSKDDVPHIFRLIPVLRYGVSRTISPKVKEACGESLELLESFARDIVEAGYRIRTKDGEGTPYMPGFTDDPELNKNQGDLASFIHYLEVLPEGECNARRTAELIGYHAPVKENCGTGEPGLYDGIAFEINRYNKRICRYFHVGHVANALVNSDNEATLQLLDGLEERMDLEFATPPGERQYTQSRWDADLSLYLAQSHVYGYPLVSSEARMIQEYYLRALDKMEDWPYWDPWADSVPDGDLGGYRPPSCEGQDEEQVCWWGVEDLAQVFETCWSPFLNPASKVYVDCEIVRDPSRWDDQ